MSRRAPGLLILLALGALGFVAYESLRDTLFPSASPHGAGSEEAFDDTQAPPGGAPEEDEAGGPRLLVSERRPQDPAEIAAREAALAAASTAAAAQARAALQVTWGGALVDASGRPVAGARIVLASNVESVTLTTREDGTFDGALVPGRYDVLITAPGRGSLYLEDYVVDGVARLDRALALAPPLTLTFVLEREGRGVEGARATLKLTRWRWAGQVAVVGGVTDAAGRAVFAQLGAGTYELRVDVPQGPELVQTHELKQDAEIRAQVPDSAELAGLVTDARTKAPVGGALLRIVTAVKDGPSYVLSSTTEANGAFRVLVPKGTPREVAVTAAGYAPWPSPGELDRVLGLLQGLSSGKQPVLLSVALEAGAAVSGRITQQETKAALPGVSLLFRHRRGGPSAHATSDEEGRYVVEHINPGRYQIVVETPGWFPEQPLELDLRAGRAEPSAYDIALLGARTLEGVVVMSAGAPVQGARVWLTGGGQLVRNARSAGRPLETFSGARGTWQIHDVPPHLVVAVRAQLGQLEAVPVFANMKQPPAGPLKLTLAGTVNLAGRVLDQGNGEPVPNARVQLNPKGPPWGREGRNLTTDAQGAFRVEGLIPGDYDAVPRRGDYIASPPRTLTLSADDAEERVELSLDPGLVLAGVVSDSSGRAVAGTVAADGIPDGLTSPLRRSQPLGADGRFRLTGFAPGLYRLRVNAKGFKGQTLENLRGGENRLRFTLVPVPLPGS